MQTCSNCGAAARPGAKFCTSCGARLPIVATGDNQGWGNGGKDTDSQSTATWQQTPDNGQQPDAAATASPTEAAQPAPATTGADQVATNAATAESESQPAPVETTGQPAETAPSSWSWGQPQTGEATATQDDATTDEQEPDAEERDATAGAESSWIASWSSPRTADESTPADESARASQQEDTPAEAVASASDATASTSEDGTAETDDEAIASEQPETGTDDADARPEWMRNLTATGETADGNTGASSAEVTDEAGAESAQDDQAGQGDDFFSASAPTGEQTAEPMPATPGHDWETNDATTERESEEIIASSLSETPASIESDVTEEQNADGATDEASAVTEPVAQAVTEPDAQEATEGAAATAEPDAVSADTDANASSVSDETAEPAGDESAEPAPALVSEPAANAATAATTTGDSLGEAESLLERLRDLLPALAASGAAASAGVGGIADRLQQAVNDNAKPEFDDLRSVLEAAKERPRDVDTMLNMVARIDPMLDLLHAHGNLLDAISGAVRQLRDEEPVQQ